MYTYHNIGTCVSIGREGGLLVQPPPLSQMWVGNSTIGGVTFFVNHDVSYKLSTSSCETLHFKKCQKREFFD